jgi:4-amino-4-deoxy-L-arabinose transferase-like glycosyltransferase
MILDPKIDIYLSVFLTSTYFFYLKGKESGDSIYYYLMYLSISLGIITKGPIGIVIPGIGIAGSIILQRDWKRIYEMKPWIGILIVPIFPIFWSWILYQEYSSYGPYFFLWFQSFGRFYEKLYDMGRDPVFFISNFSWGFFPYLFIGVYLVAIHGKKWIKEHVFSKNPSKSEISIHLWFFVFFGLMLFSKYKLPQYIFWTIPAASILIGLNIPERIHGYTKALLIIPAILLFFVQIVSLYAIVGFDFLGMIISIIALSSLYFLRNSKFLSGSVMALIFLSTSLIFLPNLIVYQPSHELGKRVMELESNQEQLYTFRISVSQRSYAFYSNRFTRGIYNMEKFDEELNYSGKRLVVVPEKYLGEMKKFLGSNYEVQIINSYAYYKVSMPKLEFFDRTKRDSLTEKILLTWVKRSSGNSHSKRKLK